MVWAEIDRIHMCAIFFLEAFIHILVKPMHIRFRINAFCNSSLICNYNHRDSLTVILRNYFRNSWHKDQIFWLVNMAKVHINSAIPVKKCP